MNKVLDLLGLVEIKFNEIFYKIVEFLFNLIVKLTPQKWKDKLNEVEDKINQKKLELTEKKEKLITDTKEKASHAFEWTKAKKEEGSLVSSLKEKATEIITEIKLYCLSHNYKEIVMKAIEKLMIPLNWVAGKLSVYSKGQLWAGTTLALSFALGGIVIYKQVDQIQKTEYIHKRGPASVYQETLGKPVYHKQNAKMEYFTHLKLPVYLKTGGKGLKKISLDFNLTTNYRKTNQYVKEHYAQIQNQLIMSFEPIVPEFTLKTEGKEVIREKIKAEVNNFLKAKKVEGEVTDVHIIYIQGT